MRDGLQYTGKGDLIGLVRNPCSIMNLRAQQYQGLVKGAIGYRKKYVGVSQENGKGAKEKKVQFAEATQKEPSSYRIVIEVSGVINRKTSS